MKHKKIDSWYLIRLRKGEKLIKKLSEFCCRKNIRAGLFNGIGASSDVELGYFDSAAKEYSSKKLKGQYEIASLQGNISTLDNKSYIHAHVVLGDSQFNSLSGHLGEAVISPTCEIFLLPLSQEVKRKKDEKTGLNLLDI